MADDQVVVAGADQPVANAAAAQNGNQQESPGFFGVLRGFLVRALIIYFITSFFRKSPQQPATTLDTPGSVSEPASKVPAINVFSDGIFMDLYVYLSEKDEFQFGDNSKLIWFKEDLSYGDWLSGVNADGAHTKSLTLKTSESLKNNGSIYLHTFLVKSGFSPNPKAEGRHNSRATMYTSKKLNKHRKRKYHRTSNLITGHTELTEEEIKKAESMKVEIMSHWHPNITINIVHDFTQWVRGSVPPPLDEYIEFSPAGDSYKPILFFNTYWNLNKEYVPINRTSETLNLTVTFQPLTLFKWQMYAAQSMKNKFSGAALIESISGADEEEDDHDALKEAFLETSPYLLGLTFLVSILHSVFELLAFKNDVQFWNNRKSLEGLSVRSVFFNVFQSLIVLLYVLDHETNFVIKVSCFIGLCIELWKITKVTDVSLNYDRKFFGIPSICFKDKGTYVQSNTRRFDEMAFRYLGIALFPLLGGYCVYSLVYHEHKGWYSFVLSMLYGFLLTFGFIMMTPQLFINYKLKSIAHLPWRMLTYKALNTFIDDIFAFVIKMPTMYRLGCLRDDVIFFIFLYQRYIYPMDPTRMNEFGFSQEMLQQTKAKKEEGPEKEEANGSVENSQPKSLEDKKED